MSKIVAFGLFSGDKGDSIDMWMIKITIKANEIDMEVLLISKVDNIQKPCSSVKSGFFPLFYWFVNFTLTGKHDSKNLSGLICPCPWKGRLKAKTKNQKISRFTTDVHPKSSVSET